MIGLFPDPYPDELLYSICARFQDRVKYPTHSSVGRELFGVLVKAPIDFPTHLGYLVANLPPQYCYTVDQLIDNHTLLPFYAPFHPHERINSIRNAMAGSDNASIHGSLGILNSEIKPPKWLQFCPLCRDQDSKKFGESYWHRVHQLPGVEVCATHLVFLETSSVRTQDRKRVYEFTSAEQEIHKTSPRQLNISNSHHKILLNIAEDAAWLLNQKCLSANFDLLYERYYFLLRTQGLTSFSGRLRGSEFIKAFESYYSPKLLELLQSEVDKLTKKQWPISWFATSNQISHHPLRHLLVMNFLGYRAEDFFKIQPIEYKPFGKGPWPCLNSASDHFNKAKIKECRVQLNGNNSKPIGIFSCTFCGFVYSRTDHDSSSKNKLQTIKVQTYGPVWDTALTKLWNDSTLKLVEIVQRLGVHHTTIKRQAGRLNLIFPRPSARLIQGALTPPRQKDSQIAMAAETLESYRQQWLSAIKQNPGLGRSAFAQRFQRIHRWLYQNDLEWLKNNLPATQLETQRMPKLDWENRDIQLADAVRLSGLRLKNSLDKPIRVSVEAIGKELGQTARITKQIDQLPLTTKALAEVVETMEDFTIRKIYWAAEHFRQDRIYLTQWQFLRKAGLEGSKFLTVPKVQDAIVTAMKYCNSLDTSITTYTPPSEASISENLVEEDLMLGCFPDSYPDELFYSICARFHDRVLYPSQRSTIRDLFQTKNAIAIFDLPSRLDKFIANLPAGHRYTAEYLIDNYTLLPFYRPFLPPDRLQLVFEDMCSDNGSKIHTRLGIVAGSIQMPTYLRFCPICIQKDREQFGESYWHRLHQVSGVEVCPTHEVFLEQSSLQTHNRRRLYEFISAERITANVYPRQINLSNICHKFLLKIASEVEWLLNDCQSVPGLESLYLNYRTLAMNNPELVTYAGRIRLQEFLRNFKNYYPAEVLEILQCQLNEQSRGNWLCELMHFPRRVHHPLRHLLLINFLGFTAKEFFELKEAPKPFGDAPWPCLNPVCKNFKKPVISECRITYSQETHRPTGNFACTCGFAYFRIGPDKSPEDRFKFCRVKVYGIIWQKSLKTLWKESSLTLNDLEKRLGVRATTVLRQAALLKLTFPRPNSRARATELCASLKPRFVGPHILAPEVLESYRNLWLEKIANNPRLGRTQLRSQIPAVYAQLYNYDREWLKEHLPPPQAKNGLSGVDWASRDATTMEAVKVATQRLKENVNPIIWITQTTIANSLNYPASAWIKKFLNKLPMTANVVRELSETREEFAVRRVQWAADCFRQENLCPQRWELVRRASLRPKTTELPLVKEAIATALEALGSLLVP
ncbi:TnsD family Tn7-like transposition protein [Nostoc sp. DSM 114167]|jgi:hypothetical protein|uniref:TnsD family Tn7-like transposition protein n=1 Tax=Nostoc sp. DSM 114167 TaxID=3439050 RepID=UPI004045A2FC